MPGINRVEPYSALADVYQAAGMADYSAGLAPRLLNLAFEMEWTGRSLLDLACGTGELACWFSGQGFRATGVDLSPAMLRPATAKAQEDGLSADFEVADIRAYKPDSHVELVTCVGGSLNYIPKLSDLEAVFRLARASLAKDKLFAFDLFTIRGLAHYQNT
ncbi:MAG TPA: class I SAM-dependent methyltransferase, partial [Aggregatilineales bacterium]|nr:class I SAM-dependent methyltransferase [Aggregatilineales bacterium]